jgi:hypothetical protein
MRRVIASSLGKMPTTSVRRLISPLKPFERIDGMDFRPVIFREAHEGERVGLCFVHEGSKLRHLWTQLIGDRPPLLAGSLGVVLEPADLAFGDAGHAHRFDQIVDRTGRDAMHVGLLRAPSRLADVAPGRPGSSCLCAAWGCADPPSRRAFPIAGRDSRCAVDPIWTALAMSGAGQPFDLQLHQALGGEADHLAQQIGVGALFQKRTKVSQPYRSAEHRLA